MKKAIILITIFLLLFLLGISINAEEQTISCIEDQKLVDTLIQTFDKSELDILNDEKLHNKDLPDINFSEKPIVIIYDHVYWEYSYLSLHDVLSTMPVQSSMDYAVFGDKTIRVRKALVYGQKIPQIVISSEPADANFINDIQKMSSKMLILGNECEILQIVTFDGYSSHQGTLTYVDTDKGMFVKYYPDQVSEGSWFTEEDFRKYAKAYYEYISAYENNYAENGQGLNGNISLLEYIDTKYGKVIPSVNTDEKDFSYLWFVIPIGVYITASAVILLVFRKKLFKSLNKA